MSEEDKTNISAMTLEQCVQTLQTMGRTVTIHDIMKDMKNGAPKNEDGTIHVVKYTAWVLNELGDDIHE